jgi:hypothetical protein
MKVDETTVHGRVAPVKTEYSNDELPLDPDFATKLLNWKLASNAENRAWCFQTTSQAVLPRVAAPAGLDPARRLVPGEVPEVRGRARGSPISPAQRSSARCR